MPSRTYNTTDYRFGYNGMEKNTPKEHDVYDGSSYTTEFRQYDPRLGRWLSLDPLMAKYSEWSPYVAFENNPVLYNDPLGLEVDKDKGGKEKKYKNSGKAADRWIKKNTEKGNILPGAYKETDKDGNTIVHYEKASKMKVWTDGFENVAEEKSVILKKSKTFKQNGPRVKSNEAGCHKLPPLVKMTLIKKAVEEATEKGRNTLVQRAIGGAFRTVGLTLTAIFMDHGGYNPEAGMNEQPNFEFKPSTDSDKEKDKENYTTIYRNVNEAEYKQIISGGYNFAFGSGMQVKQFWLDPTGLAGWNATPFSGEYNISILVPKSIIGPGNILNTATQVDPHLGRTATIDSQIDLNIFNKVKIVTIILPTH